VNPLELLNYQAPADLLADKVILVTGASDGIGRAVALAFAEHSAQVIALDKKQRRLETLHDEIVAAGAPHAPILVVQDLAKLDSSHSQQIAAGIQHDCGRLDGLLHNAAELPGLTGLHRYSEQDWDRVMAVNLKAPYLLTQALLPLLMSSGHPSVLFSSADVGRRGRAYWGAYAAAYGGIEVLAQVWSAETETNTNIRFNTIDPGPVRTALRVRAYAGEDPSETAPPDSIVGAYLYLMGDDSLSVRGQAICLDQRARTMESA